MYNNLNDDEEIIMKRLIRNAKARIKYNEATVNKCNKKLINLETPSKRGRKPNIKEIDVHFLPGPEPTDKEKLFLLVQQQDRKQQYNKTKINLIKS